MLTDQEANAVLNATPADWLLFMIALHWQEQICEERYWEVK